MSPPERRPAPGEPGAGQNTSAAEIDDHLALTVLQHLWADGAHSLNWRHRPDTDFTFEGTYLAPSALLDRAGQLDGCTWWGVNATTGARSRGTNNDVVEAVALYADLDWQDPEGHKSKGLPVEETVRSVLAGVMPQPTAVIETGGGLQPYWRLKEPVDRDTFERGQELLKAAFEAEGLHVEGTVTNQVLRVPGTWNHKYTPPRPVTVAEFTPRADGSGITVEMFEQRFGHLVAKQEQAEAAEADSFLAQLDKGTGSGPISDYNAAHSIADELKASGWQENRRYWSRPGRDKLGQSARIHADERGEVLMVYSTSPELERLRSLGKPCRGNSEIVMASAFDLHAEREHAGDYDDALAAIRTNPPPNVDPNTGEIARPTEGRADEERVVPAACRFGDDWWQRTSQLSHVAQLADSRMISRESVLAAVLVNASLHVPAALRLAGPPRDGTPNLVVVLAGPPGEGKGSSIDAAADVVPQPTMTRRLPTGTAEGFVRRFFERNPDDDERKRAPLVRHYFPVYMRVDEVGAWQQQTNRSSNDAGGGLVAQIKQACSGEALGFGYANPEKGLVVDPLTYRTGVVIGLVPKHAAAMFGDRGGGLPERMLFAPALVEHLPSIEELDRLPDDPGKLEGWQSPWRQRAVGDDTPHGVVWVDASVRQRVLAENLEQRRRVHEGAADADLDAHRTYNRLRVAVAMATLHGDRTVTAESYDLAGDVLDVSDTTRAWLLDCARAEQAEIDQATDARQARRAVRVADEVRRNEEAVQREKAFKGARRLFDLVKGGDVETVSEARRRMRGYPFNDCLHHAADLDWLTVEEEPGQGSSRRTLKLGKGSP